MQNCSSFLPTMSSLKRNIEIVYKGFPVGGGSNLEASQLFEIRKGTIDLEKRELGENEVVLKTLYVSQEPWLTPMVRDPSDTSVIPDFPIAAAEETMSGNIVAQVIKSNNPKYCAGEVLAGYGKWAEYSVTNPAANYYGMFKVAGAKESEFPLSIYLGLFGIPGNAAYTGLHTVCEPITPGETLFISAATGAVGQIVGQYGKSFGLRVVGSAGDDEKVQFLLHHLGFDAAFNYNKHKDDYGSILKETCPNGIDIYFETVGGKILDAVLKNCNNKARIPLCGMISQYRRADNPEPIYNSISIIAKQIRMEGFLVSNIGTDCVPIFSKLIQQGKLKFEEETSEGIEKIPEAFVSLVQRKNRGKPITHVGDPEW